MKLIRHLKEVSLLKSTKVKQPNGQYVKSYTKVHGYNVLIRNLEDEVSATVYGTNINKMLNISDALDELYKYLIVKVENVEDNISLYAINIDNTLYKIVSVKPNNIHIERIGTLDESISL